MQGRGRGTAFVTVHSLSASFSGSACMAGADSAAQRHGFMRISEPTAGHEPSGRPLWPCDSNAAQDAPFLHSAIGHFVIGRIWSSHVSGTFEVAFQVSLQTDEVRYESFRFPIRRTRAGCESLDQNALHDFRVTSSVRATRTMKGVTVRLEHYTCIG